MKKNILVIYLCFLFVLNLYSQIPAGYEKGLLLIDSVDIKNNVYFLASDSLKGRETGSKENLVTSRFIAKKFNQFGLKPFIEFRNHKKVQEEISPDDEKNPVVEEKVGAYDNYFQKFVVVSSAINQDETKLSIKTSNNGSAAETVFNYGTDFFVQDKSNLSTLIEAPVVFIGYGISKALDEYSDLMDANGNSVDINNKIVLMVDGYPLEKDTTSKFFKSKDMSFKQTSKKIESLFEKGAMAILVVQSPLTSTQTFAVKYEGIIKSSLRTEYHLPELKSKKTNPVIYISYDVLNLLISENDFNLKNILVEIDKNLKPNSFQIKDRVVKLKSVFESHLIQTQNIVGWIEGNDPELKKEFVVIGAHMDHIGLGSYGVMSKDNVGQIHNGADDNASGTAGIIEVAEAFSKTKPARSIIFIAFNGEEMGMLGSKYYAYQYPFKETSQTIGMINLDMIGRVQDNILWIGGIFYGDDLKKIIEEANKETKFDLLYNVGLLTFGSDQGPFIRKKIPSAFFFSGLHDDYHTPLDDADKLNYSMEEKVVKLAFLSAWKIANEKERPTYRELDMKEKIQLVQESLEKQKKIKKENTK